MITGELRAYLSTLPGRCPECLMAPREQGHAGGCTRGAADLPPLAWTLGKHCQMQLGPAECGATEGVRIYLPGPRCPAHTPARTHHEPRREDPTP
jgi:hypothetical protein